MKSTHLSLSTNLYMHEDLLQQVQALARGAHSPHNELNIFDNWEGPMLFGIKLLLESYLLLMSFPDDKTQKIPLSEEESEKIQKALNIIKKLETMSYNKRNGSLEIKEKYESDIKRTLDETGEVYMAGGCIGHHAIYKISRENEVKTNKIIYYRTEFNAGNNADWVNDEKDIVWGTNKKEIKVEVSHVIHQDCTNFFSNEYKPLSCECLGDTIESESHSVAKQSLGNCTTRTTMELLRHELGETIFRDFFLFITKNNVKEIVKLIEIINVTSEKDQKIQTVYSAKIGEYSKLIHAVLEEAKALLKKEAVMSQKSFLPLGSILIELLIRKREFSLVEEDLLAAPDIAINLAKKCIEWKIIAAKDAFIYFDIESAKTFVKGCIADRHDLIMSLISKQLEHLLKKPISIENLNSLYEYIEKRLLFSNYDSLIYMDCRHLLKLSYIISQTLIDTHCVYVKNDEIHLDIYIPEMIECAHQRMNEYYASITRKTRSYLGRDIHFCVAAKQVFAKIDRKMVGNSKKLHCIFIIKNILNHIFPYPEITDELMNMAVKHLAYIIKELSLKKVQDIYKNEEKIIKQIKKDMLKYIEFNEQQKISSHIKRNMFFGENKKETVFNKIISDIVHKVKIAKDNVLNLEELLRMSSAIKAVFHKNRIDGESYTDLMVIKRRGKKIDEAMVEILLKHYHNEKKMKHLLQCLIIKYKKEGAFLFSMDPSSFYSSVHLETLLKENQLSETQVNRILHIALHKKSFDVVRIIFEYNKDNNIHFPTFGNGDTIFTKAIQNPDTRILQLLIETKADVNEKNGYYTPLMLAILNKCDISIINLIESKCDKYQEKEAFFEIIKNKAIEEKDIQMLPAFLDRKWMDIDTTDSFGNTALIWAAYNNKKEFVELLLEKRANLNYINNNKSALKNAYEKNNVSIMKILVEKESSDSLDIFALAIEEKKECVNDMLSWDVSLYENIDPHFLGQRSLIFIKTLIEHGTNPFLCDDKGHDVLWYAKEEKNCDVVHYIEDIVNNKEQLYRLKNMFEEMKKSYITTNPHRNIILQKIDFLFAYLERKNRNDATLIILDCLQEMAECAQQDHVSHFFRVKPFSSLCLHFKKLITDFIKKENIDIVKTPFINKYKNYECEWSLLFAARWSGISVIKDPSYNPKLR